MKCRLIRPALAHNVKYDISPSPVRWEMPSGVVVGDRNAPYVAACGVDDYHVMLPVETVIEDRNAWMLCCWQFGANPPYAEPADDECQAAYETDTKKRPDAMDRIADEARNADPETAHGRHMLRLAQAYGLIYREE